MQIRLFSKFKKNKVKRSLATFISQHFNDKEGWMINEDDLELLIKLVQYVRPEHPHRILQVDLSEFLTFLDHNPTFRKELGIYLKQILTQKKFNFTVTDAGILQDVDFFYEVRRRLYAKILPNQPQKDTLEFVLNQVFYLPSDIIWVEKIPFEQLKKLYELLEFGSIYETVTPFTPLSEVMNAMTLITQRIGGRAMETDVLKMVPEYDGIESPFTAFEKELLMIEKRIKSSEPHYLTSDDLSYKQLLILHHQCEEYVDKAFKNSNKYGISLRVNQNLLRIRQQLTRLKVLFPLMIVDSESDIQENAIKMSVQLIKYNCYKSNVRKFIAESTELLSYEITQHTAKTGEHYITETRSEYLKMLRNSLGGGLIVGFMCIIKLMLSKVDTSYFGQAFIYSMNYSLGFITIFLLGFVLATKQPAMTAAALARALEKGHKKGENHSPNYGVFATLFARVFRTQFIAFFGNCIMAFPMALLLIWGYDQILGYNLASSKWESMIADNSPIHSLAIFHAAIAGVFLFLSGIISGMVSNRDKHNDVYYRIQEHPLLKRTFGKKRTKQFAQWYEKRWSGIISNFWFGVFMGSTASIGLFLGLNLDIRHISFASGNLALAVYGSEFHITNLMLFWGIFGVGVIGLINFSVSFGLSLGLAFRSRAISIFEVRFVTLAIWTHFKQKPMSFFFPTERKVKSEEEIKSH
ncbi:recombinase [Flavobacterium sp.]|uniref:recombinase n=1 Tax=Flavobacterium sp. TaxID=239 RepID=UPI00260EF1A2|nr:recombinase [Flavobacterium sp.]MDD3003390.1 recombinase [Flavobacterium sp.]